jgi:hypothetical protein
MSSRSSITSRCRCWRQRGGPPGDQLPQRDALAHRPSVRDDLSRTLDLVENRACRDVLYQVLPAGFGGNAVRAWRCHRLGIGVGPAIRSLLLDRASGYFVLVGLFVAGMPVLLRVLPDLRQRYGVVVLLGTALCRLFALFLIDYLPPRYCVFG